MFGSGVSCRVGVFKINEMQRLEKKNDGLVILTDSQQKQNDRTGHFQICETRIGGVAWTFQQPLEQLAFETWTQISSQKLDFWNKIRD